MADIDQSQASGEDQGAGGEGFSEAFAERSKDPAGEKQPGAEADAEQASAAGGEGSATADQAQAASQGAADEGSGTKPSGFDPYAGLTPEQKAHFERLAASERSQRGRVGALSKKLKSFETVQTHQPPAGQSEAGSQARSGEGDGGEASGETKAADIEARLKAATDEYGDILGPLPELITELRSKIGKLEASATRHEVDQDARALEEAYGTLEKAHPDYREIAADPKFAQWVGQQPQGVQALANSFDPQEVSLSLQLFKAERSAGSQASRDAGEGGDGGTATGDRRKRQLEGSRQAPSRGAPAATGVPDDFSSAFKQRAKA
jgi:hypothetical protein